MSVLFKCPTETLVLNIKWDTMGNAILDNTLIPVSKISGSVEAWLVVMQGGLDPVRATLLGELLLEGSMANLPKFSFGLSRFLAMAHQCYTSNFNPAGATSDRT
jgi:putative sterol carrier protein